MASAPAPGRLGDPKMTMTTDPRLNRKLLGTIKAYGLDQHPPPLDITPDAPFETIRARVAKTDEDHEEMYKRMNTAVPGATLQIAIAQFDKLIPGPDDKELRLTVRRPSDVTDNPLPALVYFHGGGMVIGSTDNPPQNNWAESLARTGLVVVTVHFRNAYSKDGDNPFPAGLNDCAAAVRWVDGHRKDLGISKLVLQGESGGGNLALATALKANKEGWVQAIDGVCGLIPFISGAYGMPKSWKARELPSLVECDGYILDVALCALYARMYDPTGAHERDPLAWPYWATEDDLQGLPPHLIVTSELDPLRDEGSGYYRKLARAGVSAVGKVTLGQGHGTELFLGPAAPEVFEDSIWGLKTFIDRL